MGSVCLPPSLYAFAICSPLTSGVIQVVYAVDVFLCDFSKLYMYVDKSHLIHICIDHDKFSGCLGPGKLQEGH
jgi:hypothetical protein